MKLEKGNFVRTKAGMIAKIISKYNVSGSLHREEIVFILDNGNKLALHSKKVLKASNNIIDLIEVGDIITYEFPTGLGMLKYENVTVLPELLNVLKNGGNNPEYTILSIVTKEMFESMQYKVD